MLLAVAFHIDVAFQRRANGDGFLVNWEAPDVIHLARQRSARPSLSAPGAGPGDVQAGYKKRQPVIKDGKYIHAVLQPRNSTYGTPEKKADLIPRKLEIPPHLEPTSLDLYFS